MSEELVNALHAAGSLVAAAEMLFRNPRDFKKPLVLESQQVTVYNLFQFGYDISLFNKPPAFPDGTFYSPRFFCLPWRRRFGKSSTAGTLGSVVALTAKPPCLVGLYGPHDDSSKLLLDRCLGFIQHSPANLMRYIDKKHLSKYAILFDEIGNGLRAFNSSEKEIRGWDVDYAIIDEMDQFQNPSVIEGAIIPSTSDKVLEGRGKIFGLSTPNKMNKKSLFKQWMNRAIDEMALYCTNCDSSYYTSDFFSDELGRKHFSPFKPVPHVKCRSCGSYDHWQYIFKDYAVIHADPFTSSPRFTRESIQREIDQAFDKKLAEQEYLGLFVLDGGNIFDMESLEKLVNKTLINHYKPLPRQNSKYRVTGIDLGRLQDNSVFCTVEQDKTTGKIQLLSMESIHASKNVSWDQIKEKAVAHIRMMVPELLVPDATGVGDPIIGDLHKTLFTNHRGPMTTMLNNKSGRLGFVFDYQSKLDIVKNMEMAINGGYIEFPPMREREISELFSELVDFDYDFTDNNRIVYSATEGHDDRVMALALALWGLRNKRMPLMNTRCV